MYNEIRKERVVMKMKVGVAGKMLTRQQMANPFQDQKMFDRLKNAKAID
jgi:hypothetical protein